MKTLHGFLRPLAVQAAVIFSGGIAWGAAEGYLLVGYDASYASGNGGTANTQVLIANAVAGNNLINDRSGTGARLRIVGYHQSIESNFQRTSNGGFVNWMAGNDSRLADVVAAGNARGADLITYICDSNNDGAAAVAQQPGRFSSYDASAFWSTLVAHETGGHNYGCDHRGGRENPKTVMMHNYCGGGAQGYFSNPNLWLNGVKLLGEGSCLGAAVSGGDNAHLISTAAQGVADRQARVKTAPNLGNVVRRWSFAQTAGSAPSGTQVTDQISGTAIASILGNGATFTGTGVRLPGGTGSSGAAYVQLPGSTLSSYTHATIEIWATQLSARSWARVLDFNSSTTNYVTLSATRGTNLSQQRFESRVGGTTVTSDSAIATVDGVRYHYTITFEPNGSGGGRWRWYRDGDAVGYMDVNYTLSALSGVNYWLGRSAYSADDLANCEFSEVRISNVAMTRDEVLANYLLGPQWQSSTVTLTADDPLNQQSFTAAGRWSDGQAPSSGKSYETFGFNLRTPADSTSRTFAGGSLKISGGGLIYKGTQASTTTFNNFTLQGTPELVQAGSSGVWTLAGSLQVDATEAKLRAANGPISVTANLSGKGTLLILNNNVTFSGTNTAFSGKTLVGDGRLSRLTIDSEDRLGANPATFTADHLTLNRGTLLSTATMAIDDTNRGIRIGESAGLFNVAPATTLTLAVPLSSPATGNVLRTTPLTSNPVSGMLIKENTGTLVLTHPNNSHNGEIVISAGTLTVSGQGRINNGEHGLPVTVNGTLSMAGDAAQLLTGTISGGGSIVKAGTGTLTLRGANTFSGSVVVNGGTLHANTANAATGGTFSHASGITVNSGGTLRSSANGLFGWNGTQEKPVTVNAGGTLLADGGATGDVGVGTVTLAGGTLASTTASTTHGTWRFDEAGDKLLVTADSSVTATNVKFGNPAAAIEVAAGRTLQFTGTITNATSGGISYLTKTGTGTLVLGGTNSFSGATSIQAGTVVVTGSLPSASAVTVAGGATLSGTGPVNGAVSFQSNATHAPGNPAGAQTIGGTLAYASGARVRWSLQSDTENTTAHGRIAAGTVNITSGATIDLVLNGPGSTVDFTHAFWSAPRSWTLLAATSMSGGFTLGTISTDASGRDVSSFGQFSLQHDASGVTVSFAPNAVAVSPSETWLLHHFPEEWSNASVAGDDADPDGDGLPNLLEYALGSDPNQADPTSRPQVSTEGGKLRILFRRNTAATDLILSVMASDELEESWTEIARSTCGEPFQVIAEGAVVTEQGTDEVRPVQATDIHLISDPAHPKRFLRLHVSRPQP